MNNPIEINSALAASPGEIPVEERLDYKEPKAPAASERKSKLTRVMRMISISVLVTAAAVFLFQGWAGWNSVQRILGFLGFTTFLGVTGVFCALGLKEDKGARTALGIATLIVPVIFSQVGALIYSLGHLVTTGPEIFRLRAGSAVEVYGLLVVAMLLLVPLIITGFSTLARSQAKMLSVMYVAGNAMLLVPVREANLVGLMSMSLLGALMYVDLKQLHNDPKLRTVDGFLSRGMLFLPLAIMIGRNLVMYNASAVFISAILLAVGSALFFAVPRYPESKEIAWATQPAGALALCAAWVELAHGLFFDNAHAMIFRMSNDFAIPVMALPIALLLGALSLLCQGNGKGYRTIAAGVAVGATFFQLVLVDGLVSSFLCILTSSAALLIGSASEEKATFRFGLLGLIFGLGYHLRYAFELYSFSPWVSLALLGTTILVASSYVERNYQDILVKLGRIRAKAQSLKS